MYLEMVLLLTLQYYAPNENIIGMHDYNLFVIVDFDVGITRGCYTNTLQWCDLKTKQSKRTVVSIVVQSFNNTTIETPQSILIIQNGIEFL